jgi:Sigma-70 region 2
MRRKMVRNLDCAPAGPFAIIRDSLLQGVGSNRTSQGKGQVTEIRDRHSGAKLDERTGGRSLCGVCQSSVRTQQSSCEAGPQTASLDTELLEPDQKYLQTRREKGKPSTELRRAWEVFYRTCDPFVRHTVTSCQIAYGHDLDDYVQEAWIEITTSLVQFAYDPDRGSFEGWLRTVVVRTVGMKRWRADRRHPGGCRAHGRCRVQLSRSPS